tara:strand:+ start:80 stop:673 length:594 start_codon:yes stop_codon:yes gene_type:complete
MEIIKLTPQLWQTSEISELSKALISFSNDFQKASLKADAKNNHLRNAYVSLDQLLHTVRPILTKHKLAIMQDLAGEYIITTLIHESGQYKGSAMPFNPMSGNKGTNNLQQIGGGITYAKRYALSALLAISVDVDDDGNSMNGQSMTTKKKVKLPVGMYGMAGKAYQRDGNFLSVEKKYTLTADQKKIILSNLETSKK